MSFGRSPLAYPPGVVKTDTPIAVEGRFVDMDKVRFVRGKPEKIGGWSKLFDSIVHYGIPRALIEWSDVGLSPWTGVGTHARLYVDSVYGDHYDITPIRRTVTLGLNPIRAIRLQQRIMIYDEGHGAFAGDTVTISGAAVVGGISVNGKHIIQEVFSANAYFINATTTTITTNSAPTGPGNVIVPVTVTNELPTVSQTGGGSAVVAVYQINAGRKSPETLDGWSVGPYSAGTYNGPRNSPISYVFGADWSLDNFGSVLLAQAMGGNLFYWNPEAIPSMAQAAVVPNAPTPNLYAFVTAERTVFALGAGGDDMNVAWSSQNDFNDWTALRTNTAGSRRLQIGRRIMGGAAFNNYMSLVWTDTACYAFQYNGGQFVYNSVVLGENCGLIAHHASVIVDSNAYWMGPHGFYVYAGSVQPIPNQEDIRDYVLRKLPVNGGTTKIFGFYNARHNEVWWVFPTTEDGEPSEYVAYNISGGFWLSGTLDRTAACLRPSDLNRPLMSSLAGVLYKHETGLDADGAAMSAHLEAAPMSMGKGNYVWDVQGFWPDFLRQEGNITLTIKCYDALRDGTESVSTHVFTQGDDVVDFREEGRWIAFRLTSSVIGGDFRMGEPSIETQKAGTRRGR